MPEMKEILEIVQRLKNYRVFVSLVVTNSTVQISHWRGGQMVMGGVSDAKRTLRALEENRRRGIEWAKRYGRTAALKRA